MTDNRMALLELVEKAADADLVREMLAFAAERIMDAEVETLTGAAKGMRSALRETHRNGYRERDWDTRTGRIALAIPKLRKSLPSRTRGAPTFRASSNPDAPRRRRWSR
jgi:putative transposase